MNTKPKASDLLRRTPGFSAYRAANSRVRIICREPRVESQSRTVRADTWEQLKGESDATFDASCVMELGIGVFKRPTKERRQYV